MSPMLLWPAPCRRSPFVYAVTTTRSSSRTVVVQTKLHARRYRHRLLILDTPQAPIDQMRGIRLEATLSLLDWAWDSTEAGADRQAKAWRLHILSFTDSCTISVLSYTRLLVTLYWDPAIAWSTLHRAQQPKPTHSPISARTVRLSGFLSPVILNL